MRVRDVFARRREAPTELRELQRQMPVHAEQNSTPRHTVLFACAHEGKRSSIVQSGIDGTNMLLAQEEIESLVPGLRGFRQAGKFEDSPILPVA